MRINFVDYRLRLCRAKASFVLRSACTIIEKLGCAAFALSPPPPRGRGSQTLPSPSGRGQVRERHPQGVRKRHPQGVRGRHPAGSEGTPPAGSEGTPSRMVISHSSFFILHSSFIQVRCLDYPPTHLWCQSHLRCLQCCRQCQSQNRCQCFHRLCQNSAVKPYTRPLR